MVVKQRTMGLVWINSAWTYVCWLYVMSRRPSSRVASPLSDCSVCRAPGLRLAEPQTARGLTRPTAQVERRGRAWLPLAVTHGAAKLLLSEQPPCSSPSMPNAMRYGHVTSWCLCASIITQEEFVLNKTAEPILSAIENKETKLLIGTLIFLLLSCQFFSSATALYKVADEATIDTILKWFLVTPAVCVGVQKGNHSGLCLAQRFCSSASQAHVCWPLYLLYLFILVILHEWIFLSFSKRCSFFVLQGQALVNCVDVLDIFLPTWWRYLEMHNSRCIFLSSINKTTESLYNLVDKAELKWPLLLLLPCIIIYLFFIIIAIYLFLRWMTSYETFCGQECFYRRGWLMVFLVCFGPHKPNEANEVHMNKC